MTSDQINFFDHTKLVVNVPSMLVTYIDKDRKSNTYFLESIATSNCRFASLNTYLNPPPPSQAPDLKHSTMSHAPPSHLAIVLGLHSQPSGSGAQDLISRLSYATDVVEHLITMGRQRPAAK